jgi:IMP dehydrogenase/GMP reductase
MNNAYCFDDVLLSPKHFKGTSRSLINLSTKIASLPLGIPLISANMPSVTESEMAIALAKRGGLGIIHRMCSVNEQVEMVKRVKEQEVITGHFSSQALAPEFFSSKLKVGAAIGISNDWYERAWALVDSAGADLICLDVAFFAQDAAHKVALDFMLEFPGVPFIVGNVSSSQHVLYFIEKIKEKFTHYEDEIERLCFKVGIGSGAACSTRIQTGCGMPTLASLIDINNALLGLSDEISFIADGGIKNSGDCVKSLAFANSVMLGSLFSATDQAPGEIIEDLNGKKYKKYFGNASKSGKSHAKMKIDHIEGVEMLNPYQGDVDLVIDQLLEGIRSGLSYCGANNLNDLRQNADFVIITSAGHRESFPHGLLK